MNKLVAVRSGVMKDIMKINEYFNEGWATGEILPFGPDSHIFFLFRPSPKSEFSDSDSDLEDEQ